MNMQTMPIDPSISSLLAFWADAGVDAMYADAPIDRLAEGRKRLEAPARAAQAQVQHAPAGMQRLSSSSAPDAGAIELARQMAAAAADLDALGAAIAAFDGCALKAMGARQAVFARGRIDAKIMVIGEAPGPDDDLQGAPFVGRAGKLFDRMLLAAGLTDEVFLTNTVFWRPPANRAPAMDEQAVCAPFVERAIELVQPQYLLLLGGAVTRSMLQRTEGILSLRGRWAGWRSAQGEEIQALATLHPTFLLRQPAAKKHAWADLLMLSARLRRQT